MKRGLTVCSGDRILLSMLYPSSLGLGPSTKTYTPQRLSLRAWAEAERPATQGMCLGFLSRRFCFGLWGDPQVSGFGFQDPQSENEGLLQLLLHKIGTPVPVRRDQGSQSRRYMSLYMLVSFDLFVLRWLATATVLSNVAPVCPGLASEVSQSHDRVPCTPS